MLKICDFIDHVREIWKCSLIGAKGDIARSIQHYDKNEKVLYIVYADDAERHTHTSLVNNHCV